MSTLDEVDECILKLAKEAVAFTINQKTLHKELYNPDELSLKDEAQDYGRGLKQLHALFLYTREESMKIKSCNVLLKKENEELARGKKELFEGKKEFTKEKERVFEDILQKLSDISINHTKPQEPDYTTLKKKVEEDATIIESMGYTISNLKSEREKDKKKYDDDERELSISYQKEKDALVAQLKQVNDDALVTTTELDRLRKVTKDLTTENDRLKSELTEVKNQHSENDLDNPTKRRRINPTNATPEVVVKWRNHIQKLSDPLLDMIPASGTWIDGASDVIFPLFNCSARLIRWTAFMNGKVDEKGDWTCLRAMMRTGINKAPRVNSDSNKICLKCTELSEIMPEVVCVQVKLTEDGCIFRVIEPS
ncbi:hypothetical protein NHQ30_003630 [Ciborinia camelliae]|nr:hypothetical protein NHQ30_003630 [Ciborinia camelliae]